MLPRLSSVGPGSAHPVGQQPQPRLEVVELAGVEGDGTDHVLGDRVGPLLERPAGVGEGDGDRPCLSTRRCRVTKPAAVSRLSSGESVPLSSASLVPSCPTVWWSSSQSSIMTRYWG